MTVIESFNIQLKIGIRSLENDPELDELGEGVIAVPDASPPQSSRPLSLVALPDYPSSEKTCFAVAVRSSSSLEIKAPRTNISLAMRLNMESISISLVVDVDLPAPPQRNLRLSAEVAREVQEASQELPRPTR
jgi:hypothetical protein